MENIKSVFKGAIDFDVDEDNFMMPLRFTAKQRERYRLMNTRPHSKAVAGILMEFVTDASAISFSYIVYQAWTTMFRDSTPTFDIYEDDVLVESAEISFSDVGNVHGIKHICEKDGEKKITVVFPSNASLSVGDFDFGNFKPTPLSKRRFIIIGDSISQGLLSNTATNNYPFLLRRFYGTDFLNQSTGGDEFDAAALDETGYGATDVIIALGTNDMAFTCNLEKTKKKAREFFGRVKELYGECRVNVITPPWLTDAKIQTQRFELLLEICEAVKELAGEYGWKVIDGQKLVPHTKRYYSDEAHPNDLGFAHYALNLIKEL